MERLLHVTTILSIVLLVLVLISVRRAHIRVEYSVSWLLAAVAMLVLSRRGRCLDYVTRNYRDSGYAPYPVFDGRQRLPDHVLPLLGHHFPPARRQHRAGAACGDPGVSRRGASTGMKSKKAESGKKPRSRGRRPPPPLHWWMAGGCWRWPRWSLRSGRTRPRCTGPSCSTTPSCRLPFALRRPAWRLDARAPPAPDGHLLGERAALADDDTYSYHVVNVLIHCVTGGLVFLIVRRLLELARHGGVAANAARRLRRGAFSCCTRRRPKRWRTSPAAPKP